MAVIIIFVLNLYTFYPRISVQRTRQFTFDFESLRPKIRSRNSARCASHLFSSTCVSRCPPRSFPNQGGVCWPCHESCEICAGAGQDSCLSCAPAHLRVTDLAVCLQQCPEGYYESTYDMKEKGFACIPFNGRSVSPQNRNALVFFLHIPVVQIPRTARVCRARPTAPAARTDRTSAPAASITW